MAIDTTTPTSRRALLAGALGGLGAWAASAIGRASPVQAEGQTIVVGGEYTDATSTTMIQSSTNGATVLSGTSTTNGIGVRGSSNSDAGVFGDSTTGPGVYGASSSYYGVRGVSNSYVGVYGESSANAGADIAAVIGVALVKFHGRFETR